MTIAGASRAKIAIVGSHGVGKTTLCFGLAARLKARDVALELVTEVARRCPLPLNEDTSVEAQAWVLHTQIAEEIAAQGRAPVVLCDRSVLDNYVYLLLAAGRQPALEEMVESWMRTYDLLLHAPIVDPPRADGFRAESPAFQLAVEERLERELSARGFEPLRLAAIPRECWLDAAEEAAEKLLTPLLQLRLPAS